MGNTQPRFMQNDFKMNSSFLSDDKNFMIFNKTQPRIFQFYKMLKSRFWKIDQKICGQAEFHGAAPCSSTYF